MKFYLSVKKSEVINFVGKWLELENIIHNQLQHTHISNAIKRDWGDLVEVGGKKYTADMIQNVVLMY